MKQTDNAEAVAAEPEAQQPIESTDNAESVTAPEVTEETEGHSKNVQKRFDELTGTIKAQAEEIESLRNARSIDYADPGAPKPEDYPTDEEFIRADASYQATKNVVGMINQQAEQGIQQQKLAEQNRKINDYNAKIEETVKRAPDFHEAIAGSMLVQQDQYGNITPATEAILSAPNGPDVALHVAKNPQLAMQLNQSTPVQAAMTIANISQNLSLNAPKINEAPPPLGAEGTGSGVVPKQDPTFEKIGKFEIKK